ncbi:MAG TPA: hypothetical protein VF172_03230 [Nitrososphaera sp.]
MSESEIVELFRGDEQLVDIWRSFLLHNHWIEQVDGKWAVTKKGKEWIGKYPI